MSVYDAVYDYQRHAYCVTVGGTFAGYMPRAAFDRVTVARMLAILHRAQLAHEQVECLADPARADEAIDMLDDLQWRIGCIDDGERGELAAIVIDHAVAAGLLEDGSTESYTVARG